MTTWLDFLRDLVAVEEQELGPDEVFVLQLKVQLQHAEQEVAVGREPDGQRWVAGFGPARPEMRRPPRRAHVPRRSRPATSRSLGGAR